MYWHKFTCSNSGSKFKAYKQLFSLRRAYFGSLFSVVPHFDHFCPFTSRDKRVFENKISQEASSDTFFSHRAHSSFMFLNPLPCFIQHCVMNGFGKTCFQQRRKSEVHFIVHIPSPEAQTQQQKMNLVYASSADATQALVPVHMVYIKHLKKYVLDLLPCKLGSTEFLCQTQWNMLLHLQGV